MDAMCYSNDARPPLPPIQGGSTDEDDLILTSADGTRFGAYAARAGTPTGAGVVVIPDPRGLHPFYKQLVRRFAETGSMASPSITWRGPRGWAIGRRASIS